MAVLSRDLDRLASRQYDVVVVGGGIYGAWVACDAARRAAGLSERTGNGPGRAEANALDVQRIDHQHAPQQRSGVDAAGDAAHVERVLHR